MPDYKLEIEIDVAKFTRDIKKGVEDAKINFGQGGVGGTPKGGEDTSAQWDKLSKIMEDFLRELEEQTRLLKLINSKSKRSLKQIEIQYKADTQAILLKASLNSQFAILRATLVRDNMAAREMGGVFSNIGKMFGGRTGSGIGRLLDTKLKYMQPQTEIAEDFAPGRAGGKSAARLGKPLGIPSLTSSKTGGLPQAVKIAGFAAGLAGAAGLGKLIIDSSPLLQAMFKIVNTGIMFMLRPIGDIFALLIRPISIIFLKYAAGFYKSTLKYFPAWDKFGQAIAMALTGHPFEAMKMVGVGFDELSRISHIEDLTKKAEDKDSPGGIAITPDEQKFIDEENKRLKEDIKVKSDAAKASIDPNKSFEQKILDMASMFSPLAAGIRIFQEAMKILGDIFGINTDKLTETNPKLDEFGNKIEDDTESVSKNIDIWGGITTAGELLQGFFLGSTTALGDFWAALIDAKKVLEDFNLLPKAFPTGDGTIMGDCGRPLPAEGVPWETVQGGDKNTRWYEEYGKPPPQTLQSQDKIEGISHVVELLEKLILTEKIENKKGINFSIILTELLSFKEKITTGITTGPTQELLDIISKMTNPEDSNGMLGGQVARGQTLLIERMMVHLEEIINKMGDINKPDESTNFANPLFKSGGMLPTNLDVEGISEFFGNALESSEGTAAFMQAITDVTEAMQTGCVTQMGEAMERVNNTFSVIKNNVDISGAAMLEATTLILATVAKMRAALAKFISSRDEGDALAKVVHAGLADEGDDNVVKDDDPPPTTNDQGWPIVYPQGPIKHGYRVVFEEQKYEERWPSLTKKQIDAFKSFGARVFGFAKGGVINEPIQGIGQITGRGYMFGERGPERITPLSGVGSAGSTSNANTGGGNIIANFYISGIGVGDSLELERKLKPQILKWLKEEGSRRGIL